MTVSMNQKLRGRPKRIGKLFQRFRGLQHLFGVARHLYLPPDLADHALAVDQKGAALDAHIFPAIHALLDPGAVGLADLALLVGGERKIERVLFLELVVLFDRVPRDADDLGLDLGEIGQRVAEGAGLGRAARRVVLWIKVEHHGLALEIVQGDLAPAVRGKGEAGRLVADVYAHRAAS
jgi:hypothetical protein